MKLKTVFQRVNLKYQILSALAPLAHQIALPYDHDNLTTAYQTFFKELDRLLKIKTEEE